MMSDDAVFTACLSLHVRGQLEAAEKGYHAILDSRPDHGEALHKLGVIALQKGRLTDAERRLRAAAAVSPRNASVLTNLAFALFHLGQAEEAIHHCDLAAELDAPPPEVFNIRGMAQAQLGLFEEALGSFERALALSPRLADAHNNRGLALKNLGKPEAAADAFREAIAVDPYSFKAFNNLGNVQQALGRSGDALQSYDQAIALNPRFKDAQLNRCIILLDIGDTVQASQSLRRLRTEDPVNLRLDYLDGLCLTKMARHVEAVEAFHRVLRARPDDFEATYGAAVAYSEMGETAHAAQLFDAALGLKPGSPEAEFGKSLVRLQAGDFENGLRGFEARKSIEGDMGLTPFAFPTWDGGQDLSGRKILVHEEQGFGDSLQFCRFIPRLEATGAHVTFAVKPQLHGVLASLSPTLQLAKPQTDGAFDFGVSLLSLPLALGLTRSSISPAGRYLAPSAAASDRWRDRLSPIARPRIGVAWRSNILNTALSKRGVPFAAFREIMRPDIDWVSLQVEMSEEERVFFAENDTRHDVSGEIKSFDDTAAIIDALDLVISVDTSVVHLAGALAAPAWILLCKSADWRWFLHEASSPWYGSARLMRQSSLGDWSDVLADVACKLDAWLETRQ